MAHKTPSFIPLLLLAACGESAPPPATADDAPADAAPTVSVYELAVSNPGRSDADRERDAGRQPAEVMAFFGIEPRMGAPR